MTTKTTAAPLYNNIAQGLLIFAKYHDSENEHEAITFSEKESLMFVNACSPDEISEDDYFYLARYGWVFNIAYHIWEHKFA